MAVGIRRTARALAEGNVGASAQPPYDRLAPWDAAIRFESTLMTAERILGAYPAIRWTDRMETRWEYRQGVVRRLGLLSDGSRSRLSALAGRQGNT
jgi:hypothetical protein